MQAPHLNTINKSCPQIGRTVHTIFERMNTTIQITTVVADQRQLLTQTRIRAQERGIHQWIIIVAYITKEVNPYSTHLFELHLG